MLSERQLEALLKVFNARMQRVNDQYLQLMGEHLKMIGELTPSDVHRLTQLQQMRGNMRQIKRSIAKAAEASMEDVEKAFEAAAESNERFMRAYYQEAAEAPIKGQMQRSKSLERILKAQLRVTEQEMRNLSRTTVVTEAYRNAVDVAVQAVQSGLVDYKGAIRSAMTAAGKNGLRVQYASGMTRRLDSAMRQNVLDGVRTLNNDVLQQLGKEYGADGVEISAHALCAEDHLPYQGRQFTLKQFESIQAQLDRPFGMWNCKHTIFPIILGVSAQALDNDTLKQYRDLSTEQMTIDGKTMSRYEWSQEQRRIETAVRMQKDVATLAKASGDMKAVRAAQANIDKLMEYYDKISEGSGIKQEYGRMAVTGFAAAKEDPNLTFIRNDAKMKANSGLPKILKGLPNETVKATADVNLPNLHGVVPKGAEVVSVVVMAGNQTSTPIRDLKRLYALYPEYGNASAWQKKTGTAKTDSFVYELHWYEANGKVPPGEIKIKKVK